MIRIFRELYASRELLWAFTWRNITLRYKQSVMGFLWALFMPALIVVSGIIVKKAMSMLTGVPLSISEIASVSVKALPWAFFVGSLKFSVTSLIGNANMVQKISFPREIFPLSYTLAQLFDFLVASSVLSALLCFVRVGLSVQLFWIPVLLLTLLLLTAGTSLLVSCGALFFRDVKYLVDILLTFGIFFTPVFYDAASLKEWRVLIMLNPIGSILENINAVVTLHRTPEPVWMFYSVFVALGCFVFSWLIFKKSEPYFAEYI